MKIKRSPDRTCARSPCARFASSSAPTPSSSRPVVANGRRDQSSTAAMDFDPAAYPPPASARDRPAGTTPSSPGRRSPTRPQESAAHGIERRAGPAARGNAQHPQPARIPAHATGVAGRTQQEQPGPDRRDAQPVTAGPGRRRGQASAGRAARRRRREAGLVAASLRTLVDHLDVVDDDLVCGRRRVRRRRADRRRQDHDHCQARRTLPGPGAAHGCRAGHHGYLPHRRPRAARDLRPPAERAGLPGRRCRAAERGALPDSATRAWC